MTAQGEALDAIWAALAEATTTAGDRRELFLAKLSLALARELGDPEKVAAAIVLALRDLDATGFPNVNETSAEGGTLARSPSDRVGER